ncbi:hypothetical protein IRZ71_09315 [Flavobacterium sp. ANB]|uniref:hypothetical protein n=1 Tax=unclassified Flavobacterium TaxID=196869 RepID=UPI0012B6D279|nr:MULTISPECIES: hypothetical protein [unclassified Flavobacterium]MBF4516543.1 hypothetical protein [Flavobacterium sp. ANB]MTD69560.1 hypothetical protein [Flavobacterium sp. LC2016-13]
MKKLSFIVFAFCLIFASCSNNDDDSKEKESQKLETMHNEIITLSLVNSQTCTNPEEWSFTLLNRNACGGDGGYIAYSKKINTVEFLDKVKKYQDAKVEFETKWKIYSVCNVSVPPTSIACVDGKPTLQFSLASFTTN